MTVGLQWTHAEFGGQGEGLLVLGVGGLDLGGIAMRGDLTQEPQGPGLVSTSLVGTGELKGALGDCARLLQAAGQQIGCTQRGEHECTMVLSYEGNLLCCLLQQGEGLGDPPGQGIRITQSRGEKGKLVPDIGLLAQYQAPFEHRDRLVEVPFAEALSADRAVRRNQADIQDDN